MSEHTKEPWQVRAGSKRGRAVIEGADQAAITGWGCVEQLEVNANRIVACVNYCKGKTNQQLEDGDEGYVGIALDFEAMRQKNAALIEALNDIVVVSDCKRAVSIAQEALARFDRAS